MLETYQPSGQPAWPIILLAGAEKTGKSYAAAKASGFAGIGRTLWFAFGEDDPHELGRVDGARFEIVRHDGTWRGLVTTLREAREEPEVDGKPTMLVLDSASRLWHVLSDMAQARANARVKAKARRQGTVVPEDVDAAITRDLWTQAKGRWEDVIDLLRGNPGPVLITARLDIVSVMNDRGEPTGEKDVKVVGHKSLPSDVGAIVYLEGNGAATVTGLRSLQAKPGKRQDFSVEALWREMGVLDDPGRRGHTPLQVDADWEVLIGEAKTITDLRELWVQATDSPECEAVRNAIEARRIRLGKAAATATQEGP